MEQDGAILTTTDLSIASFSCQLMHGTSAAVIQSGTDWRGCIIHKRRRRCAALNCRYTASASLQSGDRLSLSWTSIGWCFCGSSVYRLSYVVCSTMLRLNWRSPSRLACFIAACSWMRYDVWWFTGRAKNRYGKQQCCPHVCVDYTLVDYRVGV